MVLGLHAQQAGVRQVDAMQVEKAGSLHGATCVVTMSCAAPTASTTVGPQCTASPFPSGRVDEDAVGVAQHARAAPPARHTAACAARPGAGPAWRPRPPRGRVRPRRDRPDWHRRWVLQAGGQQGRQQRGRVADAAGQRVVRRVRHRHQARRPQGLADAVGRRDELGLEVGEARLIGRVDLVQRPRRRLAGVRPDPYRRAAVR